MTRIERNMSWYASRVEKRGLIDALRRTIARLEKDPNGAISLTTLERLKQALVRRLAECENPVNGPRAIIVARPHE